MNRLLLILLLMCAIGCSSPTQPTSIAPPHLVTGLEVSQWFEAYLAREPTLTEHMRYDGMEFGAFLQALQAQR